MPKSYPKSKYIDLPVTHEFFTGMATLVYPGLVGQKWDCEPCTPAEMQDFLFVNEATKGNFAKDARRAEWLFGEEKLIESKEEGDEDREGEAALQKRLEDKEKQRYRMLEEGLIPGCVDGLAAASRDVFGEKDGLTEDESKALWTFSHSIGKLDYIQAGAIRGVAATCFRTCWLEQTMNIVFADSPLDYDEGQRVVRMKDGSLKVSSSESRACLQGPGNSLSKEDSFREPCYEFRSEQQIRKEEKPGERSVYTLTPVQQRLRMQESFWKEKVLASATTRLQTTSYLTPKDLFAFIPCLYDRDFRTLFCKKLAQAEEYQVSFAKQWIDKCYHKNNQELVAILNDITEARFAAKQAEIPQPPPALQTADDFVGLKIYMSYQGFYEKKEDPVLVFMKRLKDGSVHECLNLIVGVVSQTSREGRKSNISSEDGRALIVALTERLAEKLSTCNHSDYEKALKDYERRRYSPDIHRFHFEVLKKRIGHFKGGSAKQDWELLRALEKLQATSKCSAEREKEIRGMQTALLSRLATKMAGCKLADYNAILAERKQNRAGYRQLYSQIPRATRILNRVKNSLESRKRRNPSPTARKLTVLAKLSQLRGFFKKAKFENDLPENPGKKNFKADGGVPNPFLHQKHGGKGESSKGR